MPQEESDFRHYAASHPHKLWVQKGNAHRGIRIKRLEELQVVDSEKTFLQEFISNPLLIDNRKFDIGVYVVITSVDPLRVYAFNDDALFRFCAHDYEVN